MSQMHCQGPNLSNCYVIGPTGPTGATGPASTTIKVNSTTTGAPGTNAMVTNSGTETNVLLDFVIPMGITGQSPTFTVGSVITGLPGSQASVKITPVFLNLNEKGR